jgi:signal transduction histidine kinase
MDGIALLKAIKAVSPDAEVLLLTGHGDLELAVAGLQNGAGDFLHKPASDAALEVALQRARQRIAMREALRRHTEELEELVARRTAELIQSERFAAVGESAASLAHAIKNIAGALEGTMYVLEKGLELNKREYFEQGWQMVRGDVSRLRRLAVSLLDLGRSPDLEVRATVPAEPAREVMDMLRRQAPEGLRLELVDSAGPEPVVMAPEAVHQCLLNLTLNAVEALQSRAENSGSADAQPLLRLAVNRERQPDGSDAVLYTVTDNGPGMPTEAAADAAGTFWTSKATGNGIGLFATRKIAHAMGADLQFVSRPGQGTQALLLLR